LLATAKYCPVAFFHIILDKLSYLNYCVLTLTESEIDMKNKNYVVSLYCGDTYLDVYGSVDEDDPTVGHIGAVDIEDVCIADTETSVFEMIYSLGWSKFYEQVQEAYVSRNDA
jgi:hypothetical protein